MNLDEMLLYADIDQVYKIVNNYSCECDKHSKTDMIQAIIIKMFNRDNLNNLFYELNEVELAFLQLLYLDSRVKFTIEDLLAKGRQALALNKAEDNPKDLVLAALKRGWIFHGVGKSNMLVYLVPNDFKERFFQALSSNLLNKINYLDEVNFYRDESTLLVSDIVIFLKYLLKEEVLLTGDGSIYRRQQALIFNTFLVPESPIIKGAWRFGYGRKYNEYPDRFSLIYNYAYYNKLLVEDQSGHLYITPQGVMWMNKTDFYEDEYNIYRFWLRLYKHSIPYLQLIIKIIDLVAYKKWVETSTVFGEILLWLNDHYYEKKEDVFLNRIIKMLVHLGIIQIGQESNQTYIRVSEKGHRLINNNTSFDIKEIILE